MSGAVLYGFHQLKDVFGERLDSINAEEVSTAIEASAAEHNRQITALMDLFAEPTTMYSARFKSAGNHRLQPLDENGRALPVKFAGYYDTAFPIRDAGTAWGANYKSRAKLTVADANRITAEMLKADAVWMRDQMLAALFSSATHTYTDPDYGALTVQPLANGDSVTYLRNGAGSASADTHQLATASAIADVTDPFQTIVDELMEHPENSGEAIILVATNNLAAIRGLAAYYPLVDPNITTGANTDTVNGGPGVQVPGQVVGYHESKAWIVEWKALPDNYAIAVSTGGEKPLRMRQEPEPQLQGFHMAAERSDHPYWEEQWVRFAGFGAFNRVGAVVQRFGNGTYAVPTGYTAPIT